METEKTYEGSCFCGAVQIAVTGVPVNMGYCHCDSCRTWSAAPVNAFTLWKPDSVRVTKGADNIGESQDNVIQCVSRMPPLSEWFSMVGILDGDQRNTLAGNEFRWPHSFLPGTLSPEDLLRPAIEAQSQDLVARLGCTAQQLGLAIDAARGREAHDWFHSVYAAIGLTQEAFVDAVVRIWLQDVDNATACDNIVVTLRASARLSRIE
jgi:hypothetical protein